MKEKEMKGGERLRTQGETKLQTTEEVKVNVKEERTEGKEASESGRHQRNNVAQRQTTRRSVWPTIQHSVRTRRKMLTGFMSVNSLLTGIFLFFTHSHRHIV